MALTGRWGTSAKAGRGGVVVDGFVLPQRVTFTFEGEDGEPGKVSPDFVAHFEVRNGVPECVEIHVVAKGNGRAIRTADLALFQIEHLTELAFLSHARKVGQAGNRLAEPDLRAASRAVSERIQGPKPDPAELLREVARAYLSDELDAPTVAVANRLGCSRATAARRVKAARDAGLIPPLGATDAEIDEARKRLDAERPEPPANAMTIEEAQERLSRKREGQHRGEHSEEA